MVENYRQYKIGQTFEDSEELAANLKIFALNKEHSVVTNLTSSSIELFHKAKTTQGVDCHQWYTFKDFEDRFIKAYDDGVMIFGKLMPMFLMKERIFKEKNVERIFKTVTHYAITEVAKLQNKVYMFYIDDIEVKKEEYETRMGIKKPIQKQEKKQDNRGVEFLNRNRDLIERVKKEQKTGVKKGENFQQLNELIEHESQLIELDKQKT